MTPKLENRKPSARMLSSFGLLCVCLLMIATGLRVGGALNDLWLDEILAVNLTGGISSPLEVFTGLHSEVNHHLYTLYLFFFGPLNNPFAMRFLSIAAGLGTVILAGLIGQRRGRVSGVFAMFLVGCSYVLVLYSSEARGYSLAVFFSFLCFWLLDRYFYTNRIWFALLFSCGAVLGLASQLVFLCFYLAALLWSSVRWFQSGLRQKQLIVSALSCHLLPVGFLALLYLVDFRHLVNVGGTASHSILNSYCSSLAWAVGFPVLPGLNFLAVVMACGILVTGTWLCWREKSNLWILFSGVILFFPILLIVARGSMVIYVRYFVVGIAFLLLLGAFVLGSLYNSGPRGKAICVLFLLAYLLFNGWHIAQLVHLGRGQYRAAIRFLSRNSTTSPVTIGSDHDFRTFTVIQFYATTLLPKVPQYVLTGARPSQGPEWVIRHKESFDDPTPPGTVLSDAGNNSYDLVISFPSAPLSGFHWFIYHNRSYPAVPSP